MNNAGDRVGPPVRKYVDVKCEPVLQNASKRNLLWILACLHTTVNKSITGWTRFNISILKELSVSQDDAGYLETNA